MTNRLQNVAAHIWRCGLPLIIAATPLVGYGARVSTDWFSRAGYGVCVHYLADGEVSVMRVDDIHADGIKRDWNTCVDAFNVERFADEMKRAGAGYVVFTLLQGSRFVAAPNEVYDNWLGFRPGEACARRDLPMDLADALARRGIPLMLYYTGDGPVRDPECRARSGLTSPIPMAWVENWAKVLECFARRYGDKVKGWWIDGCFVKHGGYGYTPEKLRLYEQAIRAGNPNAIIAFNNPDSCEDLEVTSYMPFQDYTAGEKNHFRCLPRTGRFVDGEQWHVLTFLGSWWGCPGVRLRTRELAEYLYLVNRDGGAVTIDVMCYWDGGLERSQINTLAGLRTALARMRDTAERSKENLAFLRPARCLTLRGTPLPMQRDCHDSFLAATDGDPSTFIRGCFEWPWQLEVDLGAVREFSRVHVRYRRGNYATRVRLAISSDGLEWRTLAERDNSNPAETTLEFSPARARYVRYAAIKPDDAGQPGEQMGIAEIDVR